MDHRHFGYKTKLPKKKKKKKKSQRFGQCLETTRTDRQTDRHVALIYKIESYHNCLYGNHFHQLKYESTIINMASIPYYSGSYIMKSMETLSHGSLGIGKNLYSLYIFYKWTFCFGILHRCAQNVPHPFSSQASKFFSYGHPCGLFPTMPYHGHGMLFLHDLYV